MWSKVTASVDVESINRAYLNRLVLMLTPAQKDMCDGMYFYPGGVKVGSVDNAILQIENTLTKQNIDTEKLTNEYKILKEEIKQGKSALSSAESKNKKLENELKFANDMISRLENPINIENAEIQERLEYLDRLEAAGVDNWNGLDNWDD